MHLTPWSPPLPLSGKSLSWTLCQTGEGSCSCSSREQSQELRRQVRASVAVEHQPISS